MRIFFISLSNEFLRTRNQSRIFLCGLFCARPFPSATQPGFWRSGNRLSQDKILYGN